MKNAILLYCLLLLAASFNIKSPLAGLLSGFAFLQNQHSPQDVAKIDYALPEVCSLKEELSGFLGFRRYLSVTIECNGQVGMKSQIDRREKKAFIYELYANRINYLSNGQGFINFVFNIGRNA
jgi:hypothetical protein